MDKTFAGDKLFHRSEYKILHRMILIDGQKHRKEKRSPNDHFCSFKKTGEGGLGMNVQEEREECRH